jgi:hypothetical protein
MVISRVVEVLRGLRSRGRSWVLTGATVCLVGGCGHDRAAVPGRVSAPELGVAQEGPPNDERATVLALVKRHGTPRYPRIGIGCAFALE